MLCTSKANYLEFSVLAGWLNEKKTGKRGASAIYSDLAIATMSTLGSVMKLAGRQTEGFVESLLRLMGVELSIPDHSTVSRRLGKLSVRLPVIEETRAPYVVVNSTGVKVYGQRVESRERVVLQKLEPGM